MTPAQSDWRVPLLLQGVGLGLGAAAWLVPASQHIVAWSDGSPARVALLVSPLWLFLTCALGSGLVWVLALRWGRLDRALPVLARVLAPLLLLWLWVLPYLPWLTTELPLLLLLAGPLRWVVAATAVAGVVWAARDQGQLRWPGWRWSARRFVIAASLVVFIGVGHYVKRVQGFGGDEPHYLVVTHSLYADQDLRIENNHESRDYASFHSAELPMHYLARGRDGIVYSIHAPGLPALMMPAYAVAGEWGALTVVGLLATLAALAVYDAALLMSSPAIAVATWAAVTLSIPFGLQSHLLFPEMPAALLMAWAVLWLLGPLPERAGPWIWRGLALSLLPWLHMKFSLLLFVAGLWLAQRLWPRWQLAVAFLTPIGVSALAWFASFWVMYGDINPTVAYGYSSGAELDLFNIPRGVLGLAFDQEYGLLPYTPIFAAALCGAWAMARDRGLRWYLMGSALVMAPFLASTTQYYMWWGGTSVPARFIVPLLPLLGPMLAYAWRVFDGAPARGAMALGLGYSVLTFAAALAYPAARLMYNDRDGTGRFVESLQGSAPLTAALPSFIDPAILVQLPATLVWVVAGVIAALAARRVAVGPYWSAVTAGLVFLASGSLLAASALPSARAATAAGVGRQQLLHAYPGPSLYAYEYGGAGWLDEAALLERASVEYRFTPGAVSNPAELTPAFDLPAGQYDLLVWFSERQQVEGEVFLSYDRTNGTVVTTDGRRMNPAVVGFELPVDLTALRVGATTPELAERISEVAVVPRAVVAPDMKRDVGRIWSLKPLAAATGGFLFFLDRFTYVETENSWVQGGRVSEWMVAPGNADAVRLTVRNGGVANRIAVTAGTVSETLELEAWAASELIVPVESNGRLVAVSLAPETGFVPAEMDPESTDRRMLGCTVSVSLE